MTATVLYSNNAFTTLAAGISSSVTTVVLAAGTGALFPSPGTNQYFTLTFNDAATGQLYEISYCTSRTGDSLTVIRGEEGTTARAWLIGDYAYNAITAGTLTLLTQHSQVIFTTSGTWTAPAGISLVYAELWGGGGGSLGGTGASGAGGGYVADWIQVVPGNTYTVTCGVGGAATGVSSGVSGTSSVFQGLTAEGGTGGGSGPGPGGGGSGFGTTLIIEGQGGTDLTDLGSYSLGAVGNAPGGNAPRGGMGGTINDSGSGGIAPTAPGGGGGANGANNVYCQAGANGWVKLSW